MGFSIWELLIVLAIIILIFGTKKLRNIGSDLGGAMKNFKTALNDEDKTDADPYPQQSIEEQEPTSTESATTKQTDKQS